MIEEFLKSLLKKVEDGKNVTLPNTKETWERIGAKDKFAELEIDEKLEDFLLKWIENNPYESCL